VVTYSHSLKIKTLKRAFNSLMTTVTFNVQQQRGYLLIKKIHYFPLCLASSISCAFFQNINSKAPDNDPRNANSSMSAILILCKYKICSDRGLEL